MKPSQERVEGAKKALTVDVVQILSSVWKVTTEEALERFSKTRTFEALMNKDTGLYLETPEYIIDMLRSEIDGNWVEWLKI